MKKWLGVSVLFHIFIMSIKFNETQKNDKNITLLKTNLISVKPSSLNDIQYISLDDSKQSRNVTEITSKVYRKDNKNMEVFDSNSFGEKEIIGDIKKNNVTSQETIDNISENFEKLIDDGKNFKGEKESDINNDSNIVNTTKDKSGEKKEAPNIEIDDNIILTGKNLLVKENSLLEYEILSSKDPVYPQKAKILNLKKNVRVIAEFVVDTKGNIKEVELFSEFDKFKKYEFDKAVLEALKKYKFSQIIYKNQIVEVKFRKVFDFNAW